MGGIAEGKGGFRDGLPPVYVDVELILEQLVCDGVHGATGAGEGAEVACGEAVETEDLVIDLVWESCERH